MSGWVSEYIVSLSFGSALFVLDSEFDQFVVVLIFVLNEKSWSLVSSFTRPRYLFLFVVLNINAVIAMFVIDGPE